MTRPTLFALSSGAPPAAIAIVRISGPHALRALVALGGSDRATPRRATLVALVDPRDGSLLDRALTLFFPAHASVTGEDLVELHLHGGRAVVSAVLATLSTIEGLQPAPAGGFTRQAFDNGRMDLIQVEGLSDLLAAETDVQRRQALRHSEGQLSLCARHWREQLLAASARVAATLDFADETEVDDALLHDAKRIVGAVEAEMTALLALPTADRLRDGVRVVLTGPPNSGKSSLINRLAGRDVAIVTDIAGTTRDLLEAPVAIQGIAFVFIDSAGIRDASDEIERHGILRAKRAVEDADIVLALDAVCGSDRKACIPVASKADVRDVPGGWKDGILHLSSTDGRGLDALIDALINQAGAIVPLGEETVLANARQRDGVEAARLSLSHIDALTDGVLIDEAVRQGLAGLARLVGQVGVEDMLDALFTRFCIGK